MKKKYILVDHFSQWQGLAPLTLTRSISGLRIGLRTIQETWSDALEDNVEIQTQAYLMEQTPTLDGVIPAPAAPVVVVGARPYGLMTRAAVSLVS